MFYFLFTKPSTSLKQQQKKNFWLSGKLPFDCQKLPKTWHFFKNKLTKIVGNFVEKNDNFCQFFGKNIKFLSIFWQSNGNFPEGQISTNSQSLSTREERYEKSTSAVKSAQPGSNKGSWSWCCLKPWGEIKLCLIIWYRTLQSQSYK